MDQAASPPPASTPATTILLGKYQLGRLLGRGNFAKVYYARSLDTNTAVAIKAIDKSKTTTSEAHILREINAMRRLHHHPNILKIHEVLATKTKIYLVMELAAGGELFSKLLRRGKFTEPQARFYFQQLVSALHFCHQNGVAHRDLKPQNLLLDKDGNLKISDFGLSALPEQSRNGILQTACGTPAYTAPEVVTRKGYDGAKADAWSCGVILFVMISGYLPFDDRNIPAMYKKIYEKDYKFPDWVSKQAKSLIYKLLDPNPRTRIGLETVMRNPWFRKSLNPDFENTQFEMNLVSEKDFKFERMNTMNAFEIISLSSGLNLAGLFESGKKVVKRFTSAASPEKILEKVRESGGKLGYRVERGKGWNVRMGKGKVVLMVEVMEVAESLRLVEVKMADNGVGFEESSWEELKSELQELVLSWINDDLN